MTSVRAKLSPLSTFSVGLGLGIVGPLLPVVRRLALVGGPDNHQAAPRPSRRPAAAATTRITPARADMHEPVGSESANEA